MDKHFDYFSVGDRVIILEGEHAGRNGIVVSNDTYDHAVRTKDGLVIVYRKDLDIYKLCPEEYIHNGLYDLRPFDHMRSERNDWCRHTTYICKIWDDGSVHMHNTYWNDSNTVTLERIEKWGYLVFLMDLNNSRIVSADEYEKYSKLDRAYIAIGGSSERYLVRNSAIPETELIVDQLKRKIKECESTIRINQSMIDNYTRELEGYTEVDSNDTM